MSIDLELATTEQIVAELLRRETFYGMVLYFRSLGPHSTSLSKNSGEVRKSPSLGREGVEALLSGARMGLLETPE